MAEVKFPTEMVDLPSQGLLYPKDSSLSSGQIEIKYMTAKEEDILTSANLIKSGVVVEKLLESLIIDKSIKVGDLLIGAATNGGYTRLVKPSGNATAHDYILSMNTSGSAQWSNTLDGGTF